MLDQTIAAALSVTCHSVPDLAALGRSRVFSDVSTASAGSTVAGSTVADPMIMSASFCDALDWPPPAPRLGPAIAPFNLLAMDVADFLLPPLASEDCAKTVAKNWT